MFKLEFDTENEAFAESSYNEVIRILEEVINKINRGCEAGTVRDVNGNKIGRFDMSAK